MTINELKNTLKKLKIPENMYSIGIGGFPNEVYCLNFNGEKWEVYYSERGLKSGLKEFNKAEEACKYFYDKLKKYSLED